MVLASSENPQLAFYPPMAPTVPLMGLGMVGLFVARSLFSHGDSVFLLTRETDQGFSLETLSLDLVDFSINPKQSRFLAECVVFNHSMI